MKLALAILALALLVGEFGYTVGKHQAQKVCVFDEQGSSAAGTCKMDNDQTCTITLRYKVPKGMTPAGNQ